MATLCSPQRGLQDLGAKANKQLYRIVVVIMMLGGMKKLICIGLYEQHLEN